MQPDTLLPHDAGFQKHGTSTNIAARTPQRRREAEGRVIDAAMEGWDQYPKGPAGGFDSAAADALVRAQNPGDG